MLGQRCNGKLLFHVQDRTSEQKHYRTKDDLRVDVFDYIERLYNPRRRHSTISRISPVQFENLERA
ncbi:IS3 family transposase [uncultured Massilia sp.]|uniref:IS3 family transposase n=1 Tax=uncultured Massilia sp. TaxID=169973 RepID=UPI0035A2C030